MKTLLVYPKPKVFAPSKVVPLGLAYIAAVLEKAGHKVFVLDLNVEEDDLEKILKEKQIDAIGVSATTPLVKSAWNIAKRAKQFNENIFTIIGGPHVSALPEETLLTGFVDFVVRGEGEQTVVELFEEFEGAKNFEKIDGISFLKAGKIIHNKDRMLFDDLDSLPFPAYHLFTAIEKYTTPQPLISAQKKSFGIFTSRGCPYGCSFCYKSVFGRKFRARSPENVLEEWNFLLKKMKAQEIAVQDDIFNLQEKRAIEICDMIDSRGLNVPWVTPNGIRADWLSFNLAKAMKKSGCYLVWFGVESGNQNVLTNLVGKALKLEAVESAVLNAQKVGLQVGTFFVLGNPGETEKNMDETIDFAIKLNPDFCQFTIAGPFPGTRLREMILKDGKIFVNDWDYYGHYQGKAYFEYKNLTRELVEKKFTKAYQKFYLRPQFALKLLSKKETYLNLPNIAMGALKFLPSRHEKTAV